MMQDPPGGTNPMKIMAIQGINTTDINDQQVTQGFSSNGTSAGNLLPSAASRADRKGVVTIFNADSYPDW